MTKFIGLSVAVFVTASCAPAVNFAPVPPPSAPDRDISLVVVADPQVHNVYGNHLRQMSREADAFVRVAIRPPELNLLSPLILHHLLTEAVSQNNAPAIVLGDAVNIACTNEFDEFADVMNRSVGTGEFWLMAHGNHDTYLMGTVNSFFPADSVEGWPPDGWSSSMPVDSSWWGTPRWMDPAYPTSWAGACNYVDAAGWGRPLNKGQWMRRYLDELEKYGADVDTGTSQPSPEGARIRFGASPNSPLGRVNYEARGLWVAPEFGRQPSKSDFFRSYRSYIIQGFDVAPSHRLILIDTSVCERATAGWRFFTANNAGKRACLGDDQLELLQETIRQIPAEQHVIIAGHFPLADFRSNERARLIKLLDTRGSWAYLSGHTHSTKGLEARRWTSGIEYNVGSTTDWPMVAHEMFWSENSPYVAAQQAHTAGDGDVTGYTSVRPPSVELCRHMAAAKALAELDPRTVGAVWASPRLSTADCAVGDEASWQSTATRMQEYRATIARRFAEPDYREAAIRIAAGASRSNANQFSPADLLP